MVYKEECGRLRTLCDKLTKNEKKWKDEIEMLNKSLLVLFFILYFACRSDNSFDYYRLTINGLARL